jgi:hypothetical protein
MIKHIDAKRRERIARRACEHLVGAARFGHTGRMVVGEDRRGDVGAQRFLDNFARISVRTPYRAPEMWLTFKWLVSPDVV